ncbi:ribosomal protein S18-alanine N-acetyltransferase [Pseudidiomarina taiwanensis]|nr:ribosomal protein S18-alanine N-acetyltransferase [Pseudidiomarina taiwanensis]
MAAAVPRLIYPLTWCNQVVQIEIAAHPMPWSAATLESCFAESYQNWGVMIEQELVAFTITQVTPAERTVMNIAVAPSWQRKGIAEQMLRAVLAEADTYQQAVFLEVRETNVAALGLYRKIGFSEVGQRPNYYPTSTGERESAIVMRYP